MNNIKHGNIIFWGDGGRQYLSVKNVLVIFMQNPFPVIYIHVYDTVYAQKELVNNSINLHQC